MLRLTLFILLLLTVAACGERGAVTKAKFVVAGVAGQPPETMSGSLMFTAFNPTTQRIVRVKMENSSEFFELPNGKWVFTVIYWNSTNTEGALVRCGLSEKTLEGTDVSINLILTQDACKGADFNQSNFLSAGNLQPLELNQCASFGTLAANCDSTEGKARSFQIEFPSILLSPIDNPAVDTAGGSIDNGCIDITAGDGTEPSLTKLPSGSSLAPIPFIVRSYDGPSCSGNESVYNFKRGLLTAEQGSLRVYDFTTTNTTRIMIKDNSLGPLLVSMLIPAETTYRFNLSNFVTGGTPPYTFTVNGTAHAQLFSGNGTAGTYSIGVTDATNENTSFILATVGAVHHTIFSTAAALTGKWNVTRPTTQQSMFGAGTIEVVGSNIPRFLNTPALGATLKDDYLVIEKNSTSNKLLSPIDYSDANWVKPSGITVTSMGTTGISASLPHFRLSKAGSSSASLYQTLPDRGGNHVASVYLKKDTSRFAGLRLENLSGACTGIVVDLDSGATTAMSGCPFLTGVGLHGAQYIGNNWWRVWVTRPFIQGTGGLFKIYPAWSTTTLSATEVPAATGSVLSFIPQLEGADRPLFPMTLTETARGNEFASMVTPSEISLSTGTFLFDWHSREPEPNKTLMSFCNGNTELMNLSIEGSGVNGRPRVVFSGATLQEGTAQDITQASQNRVAFKLSAGAGKLFKRDDFTPVTLSTGMGSGVTPSAVYLGRNCAATPVIHNLGARRFGYWGVAFEDIVLEQMANDAN